MARIQAWANQDHVDMMCGNGEDIADGEEECFHSGLKEIQNPQGPYILPLCNQAPTDHSDQSFGGPYAIIVVYMDLLGKFCCLDRLEIAWLLCPCASSQQRIYTRVLRI